MHVEGGLPRQKSLICRSNWSALGGRSEGLNFNPMPRTLDCRSGSCIDVKLWISKFRGNKSKSGLLAIYTIQYNLFAFPCEMRLQEIYIHTFFFDDEMLSNFEICI